jgi:olefin beta-lactone synthetase
VTSVIPDADLRRPGAIEPGPVIGQVRKENCETVTASPAFLERIVEACERRGEKLESFRRIYTGGAPVFPNLMRRLAAVAPGAEVVPVYGSTEAEPIAEMRWSEMTEADKSAMAEGKGLLAGPPVREVTLRIMKQQWGSAIGQIGSSQFARECLGPGEPGEIVVTGEHVLNGYWKGQGDAETKFRVDDRVWHRTGDAGYLDDRGRLWLLGRCEARIDDARGMLFPFAVETAAMQHPAVRRAALVAQGGRRVLFVELNEGSAGTESAQVRGAVKWAELDEVKVIKRIPLDARHNAKVDYVALRELVEG